VPRNPRRRLTFCSARKVHKRRRMQVPLWQHWLLGSVHPWALGKSFWNMPDVHRLRITDRILFVTIDLRGGAEPFHDPEGAGEAQGSIFAFHDSSFVVRSKLTFGNGTLTNWQSLCFSEELASVGWPLSGVFMFAIGIDVDSLAKPAIKACPPRRELFRSVIFEAQADIGEAGGEHIRRRLLIGFGQAKRCLVLVKNGVRFIRVPRWMTRFESKKESARTKSQEVFQERAVKLERGRHLNEDRTKVVAITQGAGAFQETLKRAFTASEPLKMSDLLVGLQGEPKAFRNGLCPVQERRLPRHLVESVIDFDRRELRGVKAEHFPIRKLRRIETPFPLFVGKARSSDPKLTYASNSTPPCVGFNHSRRARKSKAAECR
jgi:hypothetical protein